MTAELIAFPIARRRGLIERTAEQMLARPHELAEKHLQAQVRRQGQAMRRRQLPPDQIARQLASFESPSALRCGATF